MIHMRHLKPLRSGIISTRGFIRFNSTVLQSLRKGTPVSPEAVGDFFSSKDLTSEELADVHQIIKDQKAPIGIINQLLQHALPGDFSLYYTLSKANTSHVWDKDSLHSLIESNPGRAISLWALLDKHGAEADHKVQLAVVNKLLQGEKSEIREGAVEVTEDRLNRATKLLNGIEENVQAEEQWDALVSKLVELGNASKLSEILAPLFVNWLNGKLSTTTDRKEFLGISKVIFEKDPNLLSKDSISKILAYLSFEKTEGSEFLTAVIEHVEENHLDIDKKDPESLLVRLQLIPVYGIYLGDFNKALEKFHKYLTHEKFGIDLVQAKLVQVFSYQAFKKGDKTLLTIAETLVDPDELQVKTLVQLILARARFNAEDSLSLYNDYIKLVSKNVNENTGRSPSGVLTEALMVANLYDNDREFAHLLFDKAIENKIITDEAENAQIKKVFRVYGDSYQENDTWEQAKPRFTQYVLSCLEKE